MLHTENGDIVRLGPKCLSFASPEALKETYGLNKGFIKGSKRQTLVPPTFTIVQQSVAGGYALPFLFSTTSEAFHAQLHCAVDSAFSLNNLIQYESFVDSTTKLFLERTRIVYGNSSSQACDFPRWLQFYSFNVIGEITYSKRHGFIEKNEDIDGVISYLGRLFDYVAPIGEIPFLESLFLKNPLYLLDSKHGFIDSTCPVAKFAQMCMAERDEDAKSGISHTVKRFETTAISLSSLDSTARRGKFSNYETGLVTWSEAQELQYLDAVIKEAFRLHPAAGLPLERVVPPEGADIMGKHVKGGTIVGCSAWLIHRRPEIFSGDGTMFQFGMGSITCIGKGISIMEIYKLIRSMLRSFDIRLDDPDQEWVLHNAGFVKQTNFNVRFWPRELLKPDVKASFECLLEQ
ncbi:cytochrome P450 [Halenospora varia]|nr:cytochrome P450 [Halenospora varia]